MKVCGMVCGVYLYIYPSDYIRDFSSFNSCLHADLDRCVYVFRNTRGGRLLCDCANVCVVLSFNILVVRGAWVGLVAVVVGPALTVAVAIISGIGPGLWTLDLCFAMSDYVKYIDVYIYDA